MRCSRFSLSNGLEDFKTTQGRWFPSAVALGQIYSAVRSQSAHRTPRTAQVSFCWTSIRSCPDELPRPSQNSSRAGRLLEVERLFPYLCAPHHRNDGIARRQDSRFMRRGRLPDVLCLSGLLRDQLPLLRSPTRPPRHAASRRSAIIRIQANPSLAVRLWQCSNPALRHL
jgi:hypothetical protein